MSPTNNFGFTVNKQQRRGSNPRPSGREPNSLPLRHGSTKLHSEDDLWTYRSKLLVLINSCSFSFKNDSASYNSLHKYESFLSLGRLTFLAVIQLYLIESLP